MPINNYLFVCLFLGLSGFIFSQTVQSNSPLIVPSNNQLVTLPKAGYGELLSTSYDKFKDQTDIHGLVHLLDCVDAGNKSSIVGLPFFGHFDMSAISYYQGQTAERPTGTILAFHIGFKRFSSDPELIIIADGRRFPLGNMSVTTVRSGRFDQQTLALKVPFDSFVAIGNAKTIEIKVGDLELAQPQMKVEDTQRVLPLFKKMLGPFERVVAASIEASNRFGARQVANIMEVSSSRSAFLGVRVKTNAFIQLSDQYFDEYETAQSTHYAFLVGDIATRKNMGVLYMPRGEKAEKLRRICLNNPRTNMVASYTFVLKPDRFNPTSSIFTAELLDFENP